MATWGAYFSSYVKKNDSNGAVQDQEVSDKPSPVVIKPYKAELKNSYPQDSFGLKRSDTRTKELYTSPAASSTNVNEPFQRSNSNAVRMARMFGNTSPAPASALPGVISKALQAAQAEPKVEGRTQPLPPPKDKTKTTKLEPRTAANLAQPAPVLPPKSPPGMSSLNQEKVSTQYSIVKERAKVAKAAKPSISSLDDIMDLLENEAFVPSSSQGSRTENEKILPQKSDGEEKRKKAKAGKPSISSLDDMMSLLEQDWDIGSPEGQHRAKDQNCALPEQAKNVGGTSSDIQTYTFENEKTNAKTVLEYATMAEESRTDPRNNFSAYRKDSFASSATSMTQQSQSAVSILDDTQAQAEDEAYESTGKSILDYMKEADDMRTEREQMKLERQRILEEDLAFQREADRFAAEEEQMRRFVENLKREEEQDLDNKERRRRKAEEKKRKEEEEKKRPQDLERERLAIEMAERLNRENERFESERREKEARLYMERANMERLKYVEEAAKLKAQRMEDETVARKEAEREERMRFEEEEARLEAQRMEYEEIAERERLAEEERAEWARYEEEEAQRIENEQIARRQRRAAKEKAERLRHEEEEAVNREFQRRENERIASERRRFERARIERKPYEEEQAALEAEGDSEPEVLTKEQQWQRAEEKIRAAFAGLAQERDQLSKGIKPAGRGPRAAKGGSDVRVERERVVSRYNTIAGARLRKDKPMGVSRGNTVGMRPNKSIAGGLPSGPTARGFGLPDQPRAGLPSGPRARSRV